MLEIVWDSVFKDLIDVKVNVLEGEVRGLFWFCVLLWIDEYEWRIDGSFKDVEKDMWD